MKSLSELTNQEHRVLALVAKGWRNAKIAQELYISTRTVETHLYRIFDKLDVSSRTEAALYALSSDLHLRAEVSGISDDALNNHRYSREVS
jgi:DNA-binding NarL/FixJ family response regulator